MQKSIVLKARNTIIAINRFIVISIKFSNLKKEKIKKI